MRVIGIGHGHVAAVADGRCAIDLPDGGPTSSCTRDGHPVPW